MQIQKFNHHIVRTLLHVAFDGDNEAVFRFLADIGLQREEFDNPTRHLEPNVMEMIWRKLADRMKTPVAGLVLSPHIGVALGGVVSLIAQVSPTLHQALKHVCEYHALFTNAAQYRHFQTYEYTEGSVLEINVSPALVHAYPVYARNSVEMLFSVVLHAFRDFSKRPFRPARIEWIGEQPESTEVYDRIFGCPMSFGHNSNRLYFRREDMERPVVSQNADLYQHFQQVIRQHLAQQQSLLFADAVRTVVLGRLNNHRPITVEDVAEDLSISVRTLQRRLEGEQISFQRIVEDARKEVAIQLMRSKLHSYSEVSYLIGYDEPSSFRRAFKRWTGQSPSEYQV